MLFSNHQINSKHQQRFHDVQNGLTLWVRRSNTTDWTDIEKTVIETLVYPPCFHKEGKPQKVNVKKS